MTDVVKEHLLKAKSHLDAGRFAECITLCSTLLRSVPNEPSAFFLMAIAASQTGDGVGSEKAFLSALRLAPNRLDLLETYSRFLRETGRPHDSLEHLYRAVKIAPNSPSVLYSLALSQLRSGLYAEAESNAKRLTLMMPDNSAAWELAAAAAQRRGAISDAIIIVKDGLQRIPENGRLHYSMAQLLRENCDFVEAASGYLLAEKYGYSSADLYRNRAEALLESGLSQSALDCTQLGLKRYPVDLELHRFAARLHHETGAEGDPLSVLISAAKQHASNAKLWQLAAELLSRLKRIEEIHVLLKDAKRLGCPMTPTMRVYEANDLARIGEVVEATRRFESLCAEHPDDTNTKVNFIMHLLKQGDAKRAEMVCQEVLNLNPKDQLTLAYRSLALRLLEDEKERWLVDYDRMIMFQEVQAPREYRDRHVFFSAVKDVLEGFHQTNEHPIDQSLRGGTQTNGFLFRMKHPLIKMLERQIRLAIVDAIEKFDDDASHPFWGDRHDSVDSSDLEFAGAWSVRLSSQGYHTNHVHPEGWLSAVLYIALPDEVTDTNDDSGSIQFGSPLADLNIELQPRRIVKPEVGTLVLFPSYMWHGTIPFTSDEARITVALDILPIR